MRSAHPLLLLIIAGCAASSSGDLTDAEQATIRSAVERQVHVFTEGASQLDADLQMSMMAADVEFIDFGRLLSGVDEATEYIRELFANYQTFEFQWDDVEVDVLSRHSALAKARRTLRRQHVDTFEKNFRAAPAERPSIYMRNRVLLHRPGQHNSASTNLGSVAK